MKRRRILRTFGGTIAGVAIAPQAKATPQKVRFIELDTSSFDKLERATVTIFEDESILTQIDGTRPPAFDEAGGHRVEVQNLRNEDGTWNPEQATAEVKLLSKSEIEVQNETDPSQSRSDSGSGSGSANKSGTDSNAGTLYHGEGDNESDYEGGAWLTSEDAVDVDLCHTEAWNNWTTSNEEVDYVKSKYHVVSCGNPASTWHIKNHGHPWTKFGRGHADSKFVGEFYNTNFFPQDSYTEADHRIYLTAWPDGS